MFVFHSRVEYRCGLPLEVHSFVRAFWVVTALHIIYLRFVSCGRDIPTRPFNIHRRIRLSNFEIAKLFSLPSDLSIDVIAVQNYHWLLFSSTGVGHGGVRCIPSLVMRAPLLQHNSLLSHITGISAASRALTSRYSELSHLMKPRVRINEDDSSIVRCICVTDVRMDE